MQKSVNWRIRHAERKIAEGKKIHKFKAMLGGFEVLRRKEIIEGVKYLYFKNEHKYLPQKI